MTASLHSAQPAGLISTLRRALVRIEVKHFDVKTSISRSPLITSHLWLGFTSYVVNLIFILVKTSFENEHSDRSSRAVDLVMSCIVLLS